MNEEYPNLGSEFKSTRFNEIFLGKLTKISEVSGFSVGKKMVPAVGIEPTRSQAPRDFKSIT